MSSFDINFGENKFNKYAVITFGKHKGKPLNEIPTTYLCWLHERYDGFMVCIDSVKKILKSRGCTFKYGSIQIPMEIIRDEEPLLYEQYHHQLNNGWIRQFLDKIFEPIENYFDDDDTYGFHN